MHFLTGMKSWAKSRAALWRWYGRGEKLREGCMSPESDALLVWPGVNSVVSVSQCSDPHSCCFMCCRHCCYCKSPQKQHVLKQIVVKQTSASCQRVTPVWHMFSCKVLRKKNGLVWQPDISALQVFYILLRSSGVWVPDKCASAGQSTVLWNSRSEHKPSFSLA